MVCTPVNVFGAATVGTTEVTMSSCPLTICSAPLGPVALKPYVAPAPSDVSSIFAPIAGLGEKLPLAAEITPALIVIVVPSGFTAPKAPVVANGRVDAGMLFEPVIPPPGTLVAALVPEPVTDNDPPDPITIEAVVLVPEVSELNADEPPLPHAAPASTTLLLLSHWAQWPEVMAPVLDAAFVVLPVNVKLVTPATGTDVATIVPLPVTPKLPPDPTSMAAVVFVPEVKALKPNDPLALMV